jgi:hypothetical protein
MGNMQVWKNISSPANVYLYICSRGQFPTTQTWISPSHTNTYMPHLTSQQWTRLRHMNSYDEWFPSWTRSSRNSSVPRSFKNLLGWHILLSELPTLYRYTMTFASSYIRGFPYSLYQPYSIIYIVRTMSRSSLTPFGYTELFFFQVWWPVHSSALPEIGELQAARSIRIFLLGHYLWWPITFRIQRNY